MSNIQCFLLTPTDIANLSLRRYRTSDTEKCEASGYGYHNALVSAGSGKVLYSEDGTYKVEQWPKPPKDNPLWPTHCACGYEFQDEDEWQVFPEVLWKRDRSGEDLPNYQPKIEHYTLGFSGSIVAPAGAMWWATWLDRMPGSTFHQERGGGPHLMVRTPGGDWDVDETATNGPGWQRTGEPPIVTASPSILCKEYHGWLRDGYLVEC